MVSPEAAQIRQKIAVRRDEIREICTEMRARGFDDIEIAAICTAARQALWDQKKRERQEAYRAIRAAIGGATIAGSGRLTRAMVES